MVIRNIFCNIDTLVATLVKVLHFRHTNCWIR